MSIPAAAMAGIAAGPIVNPANGHRYYKLTPNSWTGAEAEAVGLGGHLVTINDAAENAWVWSTFAPGPFWIGLSDAAVEGTWVWANGEPATYLNWWGPPTGSEPNGGTIENYVEMNTGVWNDNRDTPIGGLLSAVVEIEGTTIFNATFDLDTPGGLPNLNPAGDPPGDSITLVNTNTSNSSIAVQSPAVAPATGFSTNSLLFSTQAANPSNSPIFRGIPDPAFGPYTTGTYTVTWSSVALQSNGVFGFAALVIPGVASAFTVNHTASGTILYQGSAGAVDTGVPYYVNVPQTFRALVDLDRRVFDLSIDGQQVASQRGFQNAGFNRIGAFHWEIGGTYTESYAIDSVSIFRNGPLPDQDEDGVADAFDNCPGVANPTQGDADGDGIGDFCDACPNTSSAGTLNPVPPGCPPVPPPQIVQGQGSPTDTFTNVVDLKKMEVTLQYTFTTAPLAVTYTGIKVDPNTETDFSRVNKSIFPPDPFNVTVTLYDGPNCTGEIIRNDQCQVGPPYDVPYGSVEIVPDTPYSANLNLTGKFSPEALNIPGGGIRFFSARGHWTNWYRDENLLVNPDGATGACELSPTGFPCVDILVGTFDTNCFDIAIADAVPVKIDILPGTSPNVLPGGLNASTPVAILSTTNPPFDATKLLPSTITLQDRGPKLRGKSQAPMYNFSDVNGDGLKDLIVHIDVYGLEPTTVEGKTIAILKGAFCPADDISCSADTPDRWLWITGWDYVAINP